MANTFDGRIYIVDTATPHSAVSGAVTSDTVVISKIRWVSATAAQHHMRISDMNNNTFMTSVASGAQYVEESNFLPGTPYAVRTLTGLRVVSLSSGIVYIHKD